MSLAPTEQMMDAGPANGSGSSANSLDLDLSRAWRMHKKAAIVSGALVFCMLFGFGLSRRPYYQTESLVYVQPMKAKAITDVNEGSYDAARYDAYMQQQFQTIVRPDVLRDALARPAARAWRFPHESEDAAVLRLKNSIKVERVEQSYELSIGCSGNNAKSITDVCNAVTDAYIHAERNDELAQSDAQLQILQQEADRVSADLNNDRREQLTLGVSLGLADPGAKDITNPYDAQLTVMRSELGKAIGAHEVALAQSQAAAQGASNLRAAADELAASDPGLSALKQSMGQRRSTLVSQMAGLTPKNPLYQQDQDELNKLDASLTAMETEARNKIANQLQQKYDLETKRSAALESQLRAQLNQMTQAASSQTPQLQHAAELAADIARLQERFTVVSNAINSIQLDKDTSGLVHILVPAQIPLAPKTSLKRLIMAAAIPMAIIFGLVVAVALTMFDPHVYVAKDIARALGFYPMATLPKDSEVSRQARDEFILRLLAGVDQIHRTDGAQMFLFTGASGEAHVPGLISSLARKMERLGYRVSTVTASELIEDRELSSGFFVAADATLQPVVTHENFVVAKIEAIKRDADFLFIDALPLLSSSVAEFAARLSDVVVVVAESASTKRAELQQALALVKRLRVPGAAVVLSQLSVAHADQIFIDAVEMLQGHVIEASE